MPERKGKSKKEILLVLDGNPYARTKRDRKMLLELFDFVDGHRNSFFLLLGKPEYEKLAGWVDSKLAQMISRADFIPTWGTKCIWLFRGMTEFSICPVCGKPFGDKANVSLAKGYNHHCSNRCKTLDPDVQSKMSATCMREYCVDWSSKSTESRQKSKETCQTKYGVDNAFQADWAKEKSKLTKKTRYGDENYRNHKQRTETCKRIYGKGNNGDAISRTLLGFSDDEKTKWTKNIKAAKLENHGDENYNNPEQTKKTCMEKYGTPNASQSEVAKRHTRETFIEHFGCDHNWKSPEVRREMRERRLEKHGVEYPQQRQDVKDSTKASKVRKYGTACSPSWNYTYDGLSFDSSWELAFYIWLRDTGAEFTYPCNVRFEYFDSYGGKHVYNPDFRVGSDVIEIKGSQFLDKDGHLILPYRGKKTDEEYARLCDVNAAKYRCMVDHGVIVYTLKDVKSYLQYVSDKYGETYLKQFGKPRRRKKPHVSL